MKQVVRAALVSTLPVMTGFPVLGFGFGMILKANGFHILLALAMSLFIYASSMQYVALGLLTGGGRTPYPEAQYPHQHRGRDGLLYGAGAGSIRVKPSHPIPSLITFLRKKGSAVGQSRNASFFIFSLEDPRSLGRSPRYPERLGVLFAHAGFPTVIVTFTAREAPSVRQGISPFRSGGSLMPWPSPRSRTRCCAHGAPHPRRRGGYSRCR